MMPMLIYAKHRWRVYEDMLPQVGKIAMPTAQSPRDDARMRKITTAMLQSRAYRRYFYQQ